MRDVLSDSEEFAIVSPYELLECRYIPILAGMNKLQVIACRYAHCELCRRCSHIRSRRFGEQLTPGKQFALPGTENRFRYNAIWKSKSHCTTTLPVIFGWTEQK
jgi:hypothetical protein